MASNSKIEWTERTWNPVTGCSKLSTGCQNCYAETMARRLQAMHSLKYIYGFKPVFHESLIEKPKEWKKPKKIFVNSMSDTFHESLTDGQILRIFQTMNDCHWHTFQVLTKRSERMLELSSRINWSLNIWMGVTVENEDNAYRLNHLRRVPAGLKFVSFEPLLSPIRSLWSGMDWVIVGGESGPKARKMDPNWARFIRDECILTRVPFFFKQCGGPNKKKSGRLLDGRTWDETPSGCS